MSERDPDGLRGDAFHAVFDSPPSEYRRYAHRWLLVIPFIWQVLLVPFVNTDAIRVFSLPLPMIWQMVGILIASSIIATIFRIDERIEREAERESASSDGTEGADA